MQADVIIIGGGFSGLAATWQLNRAGVNAIVLEARNRFGGRAFTTGQDSGANCDMGPSWFWDGQPYIAALLNHFEIPHYEQYSDGAVLIQQPDGAIGISPMQSPMTGSRRIHGGVGQLIKALVEDIPVSQRLLEHQVTATSQDNDNITIEIKTPAGEIQMHTKQVAIALPPRLAAELTYNPELPVQIQRTLSQTPTWMAGHAKFFAVYETPFWREKKLCGTAISRRGPLAEIHDASPQSGDVFALFGFVGLTPSQRTQIGQDELTTHAIAQLVALFGEAAANPVTIYFQDWSAEDFTASQSDRQPQTQHPHYGLTMQFDDAWSGKLDFIASETSYSNGGLIEGALESGLTYAKRISGKTIAIETDIMNHHAASMDWDWF